MRRKAFLCGWLACLCLSSCSGTAQVEYADLPFPSSQSVVEGLESGINITTDYLAFSEKELIGNADVISACTVRDSKILAKESTSILRYTLEIKDVYKEGENCQVHASWKCRFLKWRSSFRMDPPVGRTSSCRMSCCKTARISCS